MSSGLLKFQAAERSDRSSLAIEGRLQGKIDVDVGTSGTYRPIDADIETPDKGNGSANVSVGLAGGVFVQRREDDVDGKGKRHRTDSSSSSSSSSSDDDKSQDKAAKAKRKRKKKRKGILSGSFLPKFGISKKTKGKDDDTYGKDRPPSGHLEVDVPSPRELKRPTSTEVEVQVGLDAEMDHQAQGKIEGAIVDPDVEIFDGIGADHHAESGVTVRASSVEKFPAPALKSMDDDGTDVDLGLSAGMGDGLDDSTLENMDTSDLLSQIENTIQSIEAAHNQQSNADVSDISMNVDHPVRPQGDIRLQSAGTQAFDVDSDATLRVHLAKPKDGPILELPEENQANTKKKGVDVSVEHLSPSMSLETDFGTGRTSSASSSKSSQSEQKDKPKGVFPSMKFHMPKFGGKKAVKKGAATGNVDGNTGVDLDVSAQPDLATSAHDLDKSYEAPRGNLDVDLPDLDKSASVDVSFNSSLNVTDGSTVDINGDDMQDSRQVAVGFGVDHLSPPGNEDSDDDSDIDAYLGAAAIDVGLPVPADIDFDGEIDTPGRGNVEVPVKPMSKKGKRKLPKFKFGKKKAGKGDLPSGTLSLDTKLPELEGEAGVDANIDVKVNQRDTTFEVIGKRASLKRSIDIPDVETPVTPQLEVDVESSPTHMQDSRQLAIGFGVDHLSPTGDEDSDDNSDIDAYLGAVDIDVGFPVPADIDFDGEVDTPGRGNVEVPLKPKSEKGKRKLPKFKFGKKKAGKGDLPSGTLSLDTKLPELEGEAGVDADIDVKDNQRDTTFEVIGKRASLKRSIDIPDVETPQLKVDVESSPKDFEVAVQSTPKINMPYPTVDIDMKDGDIDEDVRFAMKGGDATNLTLGSDGRYDRPDLKLDGEGFPLEGNLNVEGDLSVDESSDIEAYIGISSPDDSFVPGITAVGPTIQGPDSSGKGSFQYNKGKMSQKGKRNLPKAKSKGSRNAFGKKAKSPESRLDVDVDKSGSGSGDLHMTIDSPDFDLGVSAGAMSRHKGEVKASSSEPNLTFSGDAKGNRKGFTLPRLKMPKFKRGARKSSKDKRASDSFDFDVGGTSSPSAKRSSSLPDISYGNDGERVGDSNSYVDAEHKKKKRWSTGFKLPNFGLTKFGGKQRPKSETDKPVFDSTPEADVSVTRPVVSGNFAMDVDTPEDDVFCDVVAEVKTPKSDFSYGSGVPDFEKNANASFKFPEGEVEVDQGGDAKGPGWSQPERGDIELKDSKFDFSEGDLDVKLVKEVDSPHIKFGKPEVDVKTDIPKGMQFQFESTRADGDVDNVELDKEARGNISLPGVGLTGKRDGDSESVTSSSSSSSSEPKTTKMKKKKGLFGGIHLPKFKGKGSSKKHIGTGVSFDDEEMDVDLDIPKGLGDMDRDGVNVDVVTPDFSVDQKKLKPGMDVDVDIKMGGSGNIPHGEGAIDDNDGTAKVALTGHNLDLPEVSVNNRGNDVTFPSATVEVDSNGKPSAGLTANADIPAKGLNLAADVDIDHDFSVSGGDAKIRADGDDHSVSSSSSSSSVDEKTKKRRGLFGGLHFPKFKGKGANRKSGGRDTNFHNDQTVGVDIDQPKGDLNIHDVGVDANVAIPDVSVNVQKLKPEPNANISTPDVNLPSVSVGADQPMGEADVNIGIDIGADIQKRAFDLPDPYPDVDVPSDDIDINVGYKPTISAEVDINEPDKNFNLDGDVERPSVDAGVDVGGSVGITLPAAGFKMKRDDDTKSVSSTSSSSSSSSSKSEKAKKKKKGLFGGFHLPKFKGKGSPRRSMESGVTLDVGDDVSDMNANLEVGGTDADIGADVVIADVSADQRELKPDLDVDISVPDVNLPVVSGRISPSLDDSEIDGNIRDINIDADLNVQKGDLPSPGYANGVGDLNVLSRGLDVDVNVTADAEISDKFDASFDVPDEEVDVGAKGELNLPKFGTKVKGYGDNESVTSSSSSSSSESEKTEKKKKGFFAGIHLPKFKGKGPTTKAIGTGVSFDDADDDIGVGINLPRGALELGYEGDVAVPDVNVDQRAPKLDVSTNAALDVNIPDISGAADLPQGNVELDFPDDEGAIDVSSPGICEPDVDLHLKTSSDNPNTKIISGDVDLPQGEINIEVPEFAGTLKAGDNISVTSSSSSEEEKAKKKRSLFGGFSMPKFKGKGSGKKSGMKADASFDNGEHGIDVGSDDVLPCTDVTQKEFKADMDINVTTPDIDLPDVSSDIDISVKSADLDFPADRNADTDITISSPDVSLPHVAVNTDRDADFPSANVAADPSVNDREGNVDLSLPDVEVDFDASGGIDIPTFGIKGSGEGDRDSITSKSSSSSSESEKTSKKKKGIFGGFHMPKFKGKGSKKKGGRDIDGDIPDATLDLGGGDFSVGADVVTPSVTVNQKERNPDIDVDFKIPDTDLPDVSADVDIPTAAVKVDVPGGRADMEISNPDPDLPELGGKVDVDFSAPKLIADVSVGDRDPNMDLKGEIKLPQFEGDFDTGGGIHIPTEGPEKPTVDLDTSDLDLDTNVELSGDADVNVSIPKPSLQSPDVPNSIDFAVGPGEVNVDMEQPDASGDFGANIRVPKLDISRGTDEDGSNDEVETIGFKVTKPTLDLKGESTVDFNTPDLDTEVNLDPTLNIPGDAEVAVGLPTGHLSADGDFTTPRVDFKVEKKDVKNVRFPEGLISKDDDGSSTTSSSSSSCDDKKKKKGFFASLHFPKFKGKGAKKKADVQKSGKADVSTDVDIDLDVDGDLNLKGQFAAPETSLMVEIPEGHGGLAPEVDVTVKVGKPDEVSIDEPSFKVNADANPDKFGINLHGPELKESFDLPPVEVDSDIEIDQRAPDVNVTIGGVRDQITVDGEGSLDIPDDVDVDAEVNVDPSVDLPDAKFGLGVDTGKVDTDIPGMNDVHADLPQVNTEDKVRGGLKVDVDPSVPRGAVVLPEFQTGLKKEDASSSSSSSSSDDEEDVKEPEEGKKKKKGFLPSFHFPKMKLKRPKSPDKKKGLSAASVEVELKLDVDVPDKDVEGAVTTGPDLWDSPPDNDQHSLDVSLPEGDVSLQVEEPDVALSAAKPDRPEINLAFLGGAKGAAVDFDADVNVGADDDIDIDRNKIGIDTSIPDASGDKEDEITFENFGKLLAEAEQFDQTDSSEESEGDMGEQDLNLDGEVKLQANVPAAAAKTDRKMDLDFDWAQLGLNVSDDEDEIDPSTDLNAKVSLTKSSSKSSLSPSSSSVEENKETKKTKGLLPSLKFPKFTGGKGQQKHQGPKLNAEGDVVGEMPCGMEGKLSPSIKVDVEASPPSGSSPKGGKSPKGRLGLFKKGRGKVDSPQFTQQDASLQTDRVVPGVSASVESTPPRPGSGLHPPSTLSPPGTLDLSGAVATHSMPTTPLPTSPSTPQSDFSVVVAIDFGTTFSGYAYSFTKDPEAVHVMRKCEGGDPGVINMKTLTTLLLTPEGEFHSFGFTARDFYHDMKFTEAQKWLYFDKYKLALQDDKNLNIDTEIEASNGAKVKALTVFQHTFRFLKDRFLEELADLSMDDGAIDEGDIRWVLTVPAIWRQPAKQFMRQAAYKAGIASPSRPTQLMIALEPEAASIFIGKLSMKQLMPERMALRRERWLRGSMGKGHDPDMKVIEDVKQGSRYVVVDCGGGTVDITVHEVEEESGTLKELHKASGGMFGSGNVDEAFINLMVDIFGEDFIQEFKLMRPAGWVDLLIAFEARKRNANPWKANYLNVSLPFSFIDYYKKFTNGNLTVEQTLLEYNSEDVKWSGQAPGMLRFSPKGMLKLFSPTTDQLLKKVDEVLAKPELKGISHLFLAGGFAESPLLQNKIRDKYKDFLKVVIPQEVGLATMKGAVMFGQNPWAVSSRRTRLMYGVGALNKFNSKIHPEEKKIVKDGVEWCRDVFDVFVHADQSISAGEKVTRSYAPASAEQEAIKINIYCSENEDARFITDDQVRQCGTLTIDLRSQNKPATRRRELQLSMHFGETEMRVDALDVTTGKKVEARVDFLNN